MNYELAKELKEAGFPQGEELVYPPYQGELDTSRLEGVYVPTLEELIEECGEYGLESLQASFDGSWKRYWITESAPVRESKIGEGSTPTEAVARLWLELNKK